MKSDKGRCRYQNPDGWCCDQPSGESGLCYWHDPEIDKSNHDVKSQVEQWAAEGKPLDGFQLAKTNLADLNLVNRAAKWVTSVVRPIFTVPISVMRTFLA